ncbi:hypothetical protein TNCV_1095671 [Trichonephila clavipes]|nr:hypothetical protein TNCV_1095671 [Trichonephila clavipes]
MGSDKGMRRIPELAPTLPNHATLRSELEVANLWLALYLSSLEFKSWQINLEVESDDVQELLDSHNQELTIDEVRKARARHDNTHEHMSESIETKVKIVKQTRYVPVLNSRVNKLQLLDGQKATRAFGDGPRNFEPWSSDVDDTLAPTSLTTTPTPTGGRFSSRQI